jgi:GTP-binding protein
MSQPINSNQANKRPSNQPFRVIIMGRPNTGKSTLFNRMIGRRRALVHNEPGVTRDRNEATVDWNVGGKSLPILVVDTGGLGGERFANEIQAQVKTALENADMVLFVFDGQAGLTPLDQELLRDLNRSGALEKSVPVLGIVNKVDAAVHEERIADFFSVGLDNILTLSAEHGRGLDDLKEAIFAAAENCLTEQQPIPALPKRSLDEASITETSDETKNESEEPFIHRTPAIAIVGRPNVGKSTLFNAIIGENRMITSPIAGTTVDSVDSTVMLGDREFLFVDTAGIRRKSKTEQGIEVLSVVQAKKALERADIALLVIDGEKGITDQDQKISSLVEEAGCSVILVLNKWDLHRKNIKFTTELASKRIRSEMAHLKYAPIVFVSALKQQGLENLGDLIEEILTQRRLKISTHEFTEWVREEASVHNPKNAKFYLCHQSGRNPPTFVCHVNDPEKIDFSLQRHLVNALRARWGFMGSPVRLLFVQAKSERALPRKIEAKKTRTFTARPKGKPLAKKSERSTGPRDSEKRIVGPSAGPRKPNGRTTRKQNSGKQTSGARNSGSRNSGKPASGPRNTTGRKSFR